MSKEILAKLEEEISLLENRLILLKDFKSSGLNEIEEIALVRIFEEIGGIAKYLKRFELKTITESLYWEKAIKLRDKLSHIYIDVEVSYLLKVKDDVNYLIKDIDAIKTELREKIKDLI